ncbi:hypothetical protein ACP4OV_002461 [Aristida adscensionis]
MGRKRAAASRRAQVSSPPQQRSKRPRRRTTQDNDAPPGLCSWTPSEAAVGTRDWACLDDGPVGLIAERVLADDVANYIRFRAVCTAWRRCAADTLHPRSVLDDRRFHPRRWIMLVGHSGEELAADPGHRRQFLNTSTGQCILVPVPELRDHRLLHSTAAEGLLFLICNATGGVRLLNPLTRQIADLPPLTCLGLGGRLLPEPGTAGLADDRTVLLYFRHPNGTLAFAKPGDETWVLVKTTGQHLSPIGSCAGRFYGVTRDAIMTVDMSGGGDGLLPPRLVVAAKLAEPLARSLESMTSFSAHLVDNGGELMLVHRRLHRSLDHSYERNATYKMVYKVYRVDLGRERTAPTTTLRGRAIFIDCYRSLSVAPRVFPSIDANTVYLGLGLDDRSGNMQIGAYHLKDGSTEAFNDQGRSGMSGPWTIAYCLAAYVSG